MSSSMQKLCIVMHVDVNVNVNVVCELRNVRSIPLPSHVRIHTPMYLHIFGRFDSVHSYFSKQRPEINWLIIHIKSPVGGGCNVRWTFLFKKINIIKKIKYNRRKIKKIKFKLFFPHPLLPQYCRISVCLALIFN